MRFAIATRKGINISGTYAVHYKLYAIFIYYVLGFFLLKGRTESYFIPLWTELCGRYGQNVVQLLLFLFFSIFGLTNDQINAVTAELLRGSSNGKIAKGDFSRVQRSSGAEKFGCREVRVQRSSGATGRLFHACARSMIPRGATACFRQT